MTGRRIRSAIHHPMTPLLVLAVGAVAVGLIDLRAPSGAAPLGSWLVMALAAGYAISGSV